ncbi:MAG: nitrophenyl compound nitroreductase subunit ArsF family protein [Bacteroidales bacterium]
MKKMLTLATSLLIMVAASSIDLNAQNQNADAKKPETTKVESAGIEVIYFHFTRRCVTCKTVEENSKIAVNELNADKAKKGNYTFKEYNLDEEAGKVVAEKHKVAGQALVVINNGKVADITASAFMNAKELPKIKAEIIKAVDKNSAK